MGKKEALRAFIPRPPACLEQFLQENVDNRKVEEEARALQNRLREILNQVSDENAIFQRVMYKNQNQHRRTVYFRRLLQVRRDLLLLQSFKLNDVVETLTHCVSRKSLPPKAGLQSKDQVQRRLLGAARLLQLMADPILNASLVIEGLLSQSHFMPFALTVLALLARLRVLLIQALYELIAAFNLVSACMEKMEIAPTRPDVPLFLECTWSNSKLTFMEKARPPQQLVPLPISVEKLPDAGWFIDDRSISLKQQLQAVVYEPPEEGFILGESPFELLGAEDDSVTIPSSMEVSAVAPSSGADMVEEFSTPMDAAVENQKVEENVRAELESWKEELESWGSSKDTSTSVVSKKRVAYVSVQVKESKILKTEPPI